MNAVKQAQFLDWHPGLHALELGVSSFYNSVLQLREERHHERDADDMIQLRTAVRRISRNPRLLGLLVVLCLDVLVIGFVGKQVLDSAGQPFDSDEAVHAQRGLKLALDLRRGRVGAFLRHSYEQSVYPPGHAWLQALVFILFGPSTVSARLCSLISLVAATLAMYGIGLELDSINGWVIGVTAAERRQASHLPSAVLS